MQVLSNVDSLSPNLILLPPLLSDQPANSKEQYWAFHMILLPGGHRHLLYIWICLSHTQILPWWWWSSSSSSVLFTTLLFHTILLLTKEQQTKWWRGSCLWIHYYFHVFHHPETVGLIKWWNNLLKTKWWNVSIKGLIRMLVRSKHFMKLRSCSTWYYIYSELQQMHGEFFFKLGPGTKWCK